MTTRPSAPLERLGARFAQRGPELNRALGLAAAALLAYGMVLAAALWWIA